MIKMKCLFTESILCLTAIIYTDNRYLVQNRVYALSNNHHSMM